MRPGRYLWTVLILAVAAQDARTQKLPLQFQNIGIAQHLGAELPLGLEFRDESGTPVRLADYFRSKPVLLLPIYYTCPNLCSQVLQGLVEGISPLSLHPGRDFEIVAFSFNPSESAADARAKLDRSTMNYSGHRGLPGWHFLTGGPTAIAALTGAIGFHYRYDPAHAMFIHPSGMVIVSPNGRISSYLLGVTYEPRDLQQAIRTAGDVRIGAPQNSVRLLCYTFGPATGRHNKLVLVLVRAAAGTTVIILALVLVVLLNGELRNLRIDRSARASR